MRIAIVGQQDFGKAVLEAFLARGTEVAGVFCAPEKPGAQGRCAQACRRGAGRARAPVRLAQERRGALGAEGARCRHRHHGLRAAIRAAGFRRAFRGTAPSSTTRRCLPKYRGPSLDQLADHSRRHRDGAHHLPADRRPRRRARSSSRRSRRSGPTTRSARCISTASFRWASRRCSRPPTWSWPGKHTETVQDESQATYEGWCRTGEARINWANHVDIVYNLIRGCNPAPGAWTTLDGSELQIFDARKIPVRTFRAVQGKIGEVVEVTGAVVSDHRAGRPHRGAAREARRRQEVGRHRSHRLRRDSIRPDPRHVRPPCPASSSAQRPAFHPQRMRRASSRNSSVSP